MLGTLPRTIKNKMFPGLLLRAALIGVLGASCTDETGLETSCVDDLKLGKRCNDAQSSGPVEKDGSAEKDADTPDRSVAPDASTDAGKPDASVRRDAGTDAGKPDASVQPAAGSGAAKPDASVQPDAGADSGGPNPMQPDSSVHTSGAVVTGVTAEGSGCPNGMGATTTIAPDGKNFTVAFTQFNGSIDESTRSDTKFCNLSITVSAPAGQTYALQSINVKGTAEISQGASVDVLTLYYIQGDPEMAEQQTTLAGPYDQAFDLTLDYGNAGPAIPCGVARDISVSLRFNLQNGTQPSASAFTMSSAGDVAFRMVPCP